MTKELDKMSAVKEKSQAIGEFLEWLPSQGIYLCEWEDDGRYSQSWVSIESLLARFFNIDLKKTEKEKRKILEKLRKNG